jgi:hypothetical protein
MLPEDPSKITRLIGRMCKHSNVFSLPVLIGREAWPQNNRHKFNNKLLTCPNCANPISKFSVAMAKGIHPFPSRTRKLSPSAPMVLHGKLCGRVGRRRKTLHKRPVTLWFRAFITLPRRMPAGDHRMRGHDSRAWIRQIATKKELTTSCPSFI